MFTVLWAPEARDGLVNLWIQADSTGRANLTSSAYQIDKALAKNPESVGESRDGANRIGFAFPLGILFDVDRPNKIVRV